LSGLNKETRTLIEVFGMAENKVKTATSREDIDRIEKPKG
jgi:hypothetical protein